jgi:hypothetical protein
MHIAILTFEGFNELDSLIALGILNPIKKPDWRVALSCPTPTVTSMNGVTLQAQSTLADACSADAVIIGSGMKTRDVANDTALMASLIFDAVGLEKPNIGLLDDEFLAQVRSLPERNLAVELLERLLEGEIKSKFATNVVQQRKFSDLLTSVIARYQNRSIETAQVMEELAYSADRDR